MSRSSKYVAIALVYLFVPGAFDATENLVHLATHGDLAHSGDHDKHRMPAGEHDCSGLFHSCQCHASILVTLAPVRATLTAPPPRDERPLSLHVDQTTSGYPDLLFRPPIA